MTESLKLRIARIINPTAFDDSMNLPVELRASWQRGAKEKALEILKAIEEPTKKMVIAGEVEIFEHRDGPADWTLAATHEGFKAMIRAALQED